MEQVQITSPPVSFACTLVSSVAANQVMYAENFISGKLPSPCYITKAFVWNEPQDDYPIGTRGNIAFAVDPGKQFISASGFPYAQNSLPMYLKTLGILEFYPGASHLKESAFDPPITYWPYRDGIIVAPEAFTPSGVTPHAASIFLSLCFQATADIAAPADEVPPSGASWVYRSTLDTYNIALANYSIRNLIPCIGTGGTQVRARVSAPPTVPCVINHASVGIQNGTTSSTTAPPVELKFSGNSGVSLSAGCSAWSDWVNLTTTAGQNLLATISMFGAATNWAYKTSYADGNWNSQADSWNTAAMQGTVTYQATRSHVVDRVQVK